jgi:protein O-mannosyl-transferase
MTRRAWWLMVAMVAALALAASVNSLANGFTYDDIYVIQRDARTYSLARWWEEFDWPYWNYAYGGDGYRPLTRLLFRVEWALGGGNPSMFHAFNVAFHVGGAIVVFWLASLFLPMAAAGIAAALYAVHPVHAEAIANIVGQSELTVAILVVTAVALYVRQRSAGALAPKHWAAIAALYAAGCFLKEHAIVLPALLVLAEATIVQDRAPLRQRLAGMRLPVLVLVVVALGYLWARTSVVSGVAGFAPVVPFQTLKLTTGNRILTMIGASPEWLRLLLWPARLMTDYAPPYIDIAEGPSLVQLPGALLLLGTLGLAIACWKRSPVTSFGILWVVVTLLPSSNFIIPAGILVAERTLLLPSVGAMIALGSAVPWVFERVEGRRTAEVLSAAAVLLLIGLGIARSHSRNKVWFSNETLFQQGVRDAPNNYRLHYLLGNHLFETGRREEAEVRYREALRLFPYDPILPFALAERYRATGLCGPAIQLYRWAFELSPALRRGEVGLAGCLLESLQFADAKAAALNGIRNGARYSTARALIRAADAGRDSLAARRARADSVTSAGSVRTP